MTIQLRNRIYSLRIRVPLRYRSLHRSSHVWRSLGTDSLEQAERRASQVRDQLLAEWAAKASGIAPTTPADHYRRIADLAAARGYAYQTAAELADSPVELAVQRIEAATTKASKETMAALLGGVERPAVMLSGLVSYVENLDDTRHENRYKNEAQMKRWRDERERAVASLRAALEASGRPDDKPVLDLTSDDAWTHHGFLKKRIHAGEVDYSTPNHDLGNLSGLLRRFFASLRLPNPKVYSGVSFTDPHKKQRRKLELPTEWIEETIFRPHPAFLRLNEEARDIVIIAAEVGCRQSEIHDLPPEAFRLDEPIPHLLIRNEEAEVHADGTRTGGRQIKNIHSDRKVVLIGQALEAARRHPNGFRRYFGKGGSLSAAVNKHFRTNELFPQAAPGEKYTIGGTRHAFESRMKRAGLHSDDRGEMMGHSVQSARNRELYGDGMPLEVRRLIAQVIVFGDAVSDKERRAARRELARLGLFK